MSWTPVPHRQSLLVALAVVATWGVMAGAFSALFGRPVVPGLWKETWGFASLSGLLRMTIALLTAAAMAVVKGRLERHFGHPPEAFWLTWAQMITWLFIFSLWLMMLQSSHPDLSIPVMIRLGIAAAWLFHRAALFGHRRQIERKQEREETRQRKAAERTLREETRAKKASRP